MEIGNCWLGYGVKFGRIVGFLGMESMDGEIANLWYPEISHELNVTSVRFGAGLGGAAGLVAILLFNCSSPYELNETNVSDWSVNVALGENWKGVVNGLKDYKFFEVLANISGKLRTASPDNITSIRNGMSYLYTVYDIASMSGPKLISVDIPCAGVGAELSVNYMEGEVIVGDMVKGNWID